MGIIAAFSEPSALRSPDLPPADLSGRTWSRLVECRLAVPFQQTNQHTSTYTESIICMFIAVIIPHRYVFLGVHRSHKRNVKFSILPEGNQHSKNEVVGGMESTQKRGVCTPNSGASCGSPKACCLSSPTVSRNTGGYDLSVLGQKLLHHSITKRPTIILRPSAAFLTCTRQTDPWPQERAPPAPSLPELTMSNCVAA